jgi:hypothetical protein
MWSFRISPWKTWTRIAHCIKIVCLIQRTIRENVTISKTNHTVCKVHNHYCVFFSKITTAKLTFLNYPRCGLRLPIPLAVRSKAWACGRLHAGTTGSNPPGHGCLSLLSLVCCQVEVVASGWSLISRSPNERCVWVWSWTLDNEQALVHWGLLETYAALLARVSLLWDMTPWQWVIGSRLFKRLWWRHVQRRNSFRPNTIDTWRWGQCFPPKVRIRLHWQIIVSQGKLIPIYISPMPATYIASLYL